MTKFSKLFIELRIYQPIEHDLLLDWYKSTEAGQTILRDVLKDAFKDKNTRNNIAAMARQNLKGVNNAQK
jgi:hypothetical protein